MSEQNELDRIILELLGKKDYIGQKHSVVVYKGDKIVKMDLSNLDLITLPDGFFDNFTELKELNLSQNSFSSLPEDIFKQLTQLIVLDLSYMIDPSDLGMDDKVTLPENMFHSQKKLQYLNLRGNQLEILPDGIFSELYDLERLDLSHNLLAILPPSIGSLVNLENLKLDSNFLPMEFENSYDGYIEVQTFLEPFQQEWMSLNEVSVANDELKDDNKIIEDELKRAFSMLEEMFEE